MKGNKRFADNLDVLKDIYEKRMPFNRLLDIEIIRLELEEVQVRIDMRQELIGNFVREILHGGAISSVLDLTGGLIVSVKLLKQLENENDEEIARCMARLGTIDLRVDYLRAGKGEYFIASGSLLRQGNRVAVTRTELHNDKKLLIAAGTSTYQIG
ncbi:thioesterase family protein [Desulfopila inferna]|uniref:thioesterase family protein n=1 Tax=Desulfopila inferna TaxID=468528 RepID=UPI001966C41B|nr:thioesterase family protein [Desulfopila inferna]MBM9606397.1 thioesterase family protein [Desulfopila inferna]